MAQADLNVANQSGSAFRADLNNQLLALGTLMSGTSEPSTTYAYMLWADTTAGLLKQRNAANNAWVTIGTLGSTNLGLLPTGGTLTAALGSASTPGVTFTGDLDTGLYSPGANQAALGTNGQQRLAIDGSGRVLVGPGTAREVGGAVIPTLAVESLGQAAAFVRNSNDTSGGIIALGKSRGTAAGAVTVVQDGDILGELRFCGANGTDLTSIGAHIRAIVSGEVGTAGDTTDMPTSLAFSTTPDGAATATQRMVITSAGAVGIGTTSPGSPLDVAGEIRIYPASGDANLRFGSGGVEKGRIAVNSSSNCIIETAGTERLRIDSSGRLLVGTSSAFDSANLATSYNAGIEGNGSFAGIALKTNKNSTEAAYISLGKSRGTTANSKTVVSSGDTLGYLGFEGADGTNMKEAASIAAFVDGTPGANDMPGRLVFSTTADGASSPTERMRIDNAGNISSFAASATPSYTIRNASTAGTSTVFIQGLYSASSTTSGGTASIYVFTNGDIQNTNNSYTALSDVKLKENVVDANSQWADIKALRVRNYNLKEGQTHKQIGLVAQEVEPISPGLVYETPDRDADGNDLGTTTKAVQYSVLYMKAVKALQEAMERIETLEAEVAALKGA